jgi:hypothetical protein
LFGGNGAASAAQQQANLLEQQQQYRANQQKKDIGAVDTAFQPFDNNYYKGFTNAYENNLNPQLDFQYHRAGDQLAAGLAGTDQDQGSTGARKTADLYQTYAGARGNIANSAYDATNQLRSTVDNAKTGLYGLAQSAINPLTMSEQAQGAAGSIVAPQAYPTIGNVFSDVLGSGATAMKANSRSMNPSGPSNWFADGGAGSSQGAW